jgi:1-aminocyclopropane-1-carboxylate deaminase/D-cysteine desulfhydrase-like pyridoxal-dependent ACC family enzyme
LAAQASALGIEPAVVLATATGGTQAGLLAGLARLGLGWNVRGFAVARSSDALSSTVLGLANEVAAQAGTDAIPASRVHVDGGMIGEGYGIATAEGRRAAELLARSEGLVVDPVYTAKALAGLVRLVFEGAFAASGAVVFLHTGGAPAIFAEPAAGAAVTQGLV